MPCLAQESTLLLMAHGELGPRDQARLEEHLRACADCRNRLREQSTVVDRLRRATTHLAEGTPDERFLAAVSARIRTDAAATARPAPRSPQRMVLALAAATLLLLLAWAAVRFHSQAPHAVSAPGVSRPATTGAPVNSPPCDKPAPTSKTPSATDLFK